MGILVPAGIAVGIFLLTRLAAKSPGRALPPTPGGLPSSGNVPRTPLGTIPRQAPPLARGTVGSVTPYRPVEAAPVGAPSSPVSEYVSNFRESPVGAPVTAAEATALNIEQHSQLATEVMNAPAPILAPPPLALTPVAPTDYKTPGSDANYELYVSLQTQLGREATQGQLDGFRASPLNVQNDLLNSLQSELVTRLFTRGASF